jgi:hypothetical protein
MAEGKDSKTQKFPSETIDLPSGGKLYPESSPLKGGKIEVKYMTAREEDILTSQNLIKRGTVIENLLSSLILTPGVDIDDLFLGDKNALMIAARILAYGPEYEAEITDPADGQKISHKFNLADLDYRDIPDNVKYVTNEFEFELPVSKIKITFKLLNGHDEKLIDRALNSFNKVGVASSREITTRLKACILSIGDETEPSQVHPMVDNMLSRDTLALRNYMNEITPDIILKETVELGGQAVEVDIPMTASFFWPSTSS